MLKFLCHIIRISIHAPTRGATIFIKIFTLMKMISIHAPTRGATFCSLDVLATYKISIHAPTRGATVLTVQDCHNLIFQSTLLQEERQLMH